MKVLTVGDSFTYGDELADRRQAWPTVLESKFNCTVTNLAQPGVGNRHIVRTLVENAAAYDVVIIAWSHFARMEFADEYGVYDTWPGHRGILFKGDLAHRRQIMEYVTRYHSDEYLYKQYLLDIVLVQNYLLQLDKRYIMLDAYGNNISLRWAVEYKQIREQIIHKNFIGWAAGKSMSEWTYGTEQGPGGHFLEAGHLKVADKIDEHIRRLGWVS